MIDPDEFDLRQPPAADRLILRREAIRTGSTDADIRYALRTNAIERIHWGSYISTVAPEGQDSYAAREAKYRDKVVAAVRTGGSRRYPSHQSAAALLQVPLLQPDRSTAHFISEKSGRTSPGLVIHQTAVDPEHLTEYQGIVVTSIARTVCDVARDGSIRQAICALNSGLFESRRRDLPISLEPVIDALKGTHGIETLRTAHVHSTDLCESIGESLSCCILLEDGSIPFPDLQVAVKVDGGDVKRCDTGWRDSDGQLRVVGEFDGRFKYHRAAPASGHRLPEDVIYAEKLREDAIRDCDIIVVRWTWQELMTPAVVIRKIRSALRRAGLIR
ncbi:hypothetical protein [Gordonia sp. NPDC003429]